MGSTTTAVAETTRLIKFDGEESKWPEWNVKALAFAKSKDFKDTFIGNTAVTIVIPFTTLLRILSTLNKATN
jgi:hypothetical protein